MDTNQVGAEFQGFEVISNDEQVKTLSEIQLMLVGGGSGDVAFG